MKWGFRCTMLSFLFSFLACASGSEAEGVAVAGCDGCAADSAELQASDEDAQGVSAGDILAKLEVASASPSDVELADSDLMPVAGDSEGRTEEEKSEDDIVAPDVEQGSGKLPAYPLDDLLRLNHIQMKGTHNSYHIAPSDWTLEDWSYTHAPLYEQLESQGVRQIELDVHYEGDDGFAVFHLPVIDEATTCDFFTECLGEVRAWSDSNPGHHPVFILVEPKDDFDIQKINGHYQELEAEILSVFPLERVITPDFVRGEYPNLREGLEAQGWPTLGEVRGMVIFVMLDSGSHRERYLELYPDLKGALIFARGGYGESYGAVLEYGSNDEMTKAVNEGYLLRGNADDLDKSDADNEAMAAAALSKGAHFISTDFSDNSVEGFSFSIPGGQPSRCNPITAPPECSAEAVENLQP